MEGEELLRAVVELFEGQRVAETTLIKLEGEIKPSSDQWYRRRRQKRPDQYCTGGGWEGASQVLIFGEEEKP